MNPKLEERKNLRILQTLPHRYFEKTRSSIQKRRFENEKRFVRSRKTEIKRGVNVIFMETQDWESKMTRDLANPPNPSTFRKDTFLGSKKIRKDEKRFVRSKDREVRRVAFTEAPGGKRLGENNAAPPTLYTVCNPHAHTPCEMYARISLLRMHIRTVSREERWEFERSYAACSVHASSRLLCAPPSSSF